KTQRHEDAKNQAMNRWPNSHLSFTVSLLFGTLCATRFLWADTAYPMLMSSKPVAVQVGTTGEMVVSSRYTMAGAYQVLVSGKGVKAEVEPRDAKSEDAKKPLEKIKIKVTAAKDAQPGVRDFRLATPQGISTIGQ